MDSITFDIYHFFVLLGVLQCFVLASLFIGFKKFKTKANLALSIALIASGVSGLWHIFQHTGINQAYPILIYLPLYNGFLSILGLYYFAVFLLNPHYRFRKVDYGLMTPVILQLFISIGVMLGYSLLPSFDENYRAAYLQFNAKVELLTVVYFIGLTIAILLKLNKYHRQLLDNYADVEGKSLKWLYFFNLILLGVAFLWGYTQIYYVLYNELLWIFHFIWIIQIILLYALVFIIILKRDLFEIPIFENKVTKDHLKPILSDKTDEHYQNLLQLIAEEKLYQDAQLSMDTLAKKTDLSNGYLSKIINQKEGKNFYDFINSYRVKEVKANLTHPDYAHYSILGIGLEAGFKSKSTFNAVFKKMTGMTPSAFKKSIN